MKVADTKYDSYIRRNYTQLTQTEMIRRMGFDKSLVYRRSKAMGLKLTKKQQHKIQVAAREKVADKRHDYMIKKYYLIMPEKTLAKKIGRSDCFLRTAMRRLKLKIPRKLIQQRIKDSQLKKGHVPPNKGKKQKDYMSPAMIRRTAKTRFKKGHSPHNTVEDFSIQLRSDADKFGVIRKYWWIKFGYRDWMMYHVHIWIRENGPIPEGHIIVFKDRNTMRPLIENLECITRADHARRNHDTSYPSELREAIRLNNKILKTVHNYEKQNRRP